MVLEIALVCVLLTLYRYTRFLAREQTGAAFANARHVLGLEHQLGIANEQSLQQAALDHLWLIKGLNRYYVSVHFPATVGFLVYLYVRAPDAYRPLRRLFVAVTGAALAIHVLFPLAPPRMLPGYVDTVARYGPRDLPALATCSETANQFAAMPSLHFGWAVLVAYGVVRYAGAAGATLIDRPPGHDPRRHRRHRQPLLARRRRRRTAGREHHRRDRLAVRARPRRPPADRPRGGLRRDRTRGPIARGAGCRPW